MNIPPPKASTRRILGIPGEPGDKKCLLCRGQVPKGRVVCDTCHLTRPSTEVTAALRKYVSETIRPILEGP